MTAARLRHLTTITPPRAKVRLRLADGTLADVADIEIVSEPVTDEKIDHWPVALVLIPKTEEPKP